MAQVGRNQICPCGSGKKYKRCCASSHMMKNTFPSIHSAPKIEGTWGLPGTTIPIQAFRANSKPDHPLNNVSPHGTNGKYRVTIILSKPEQLQQKPGHVSFRDDLKGDSHLKIGNDQQDYIEFYGEPFDDNGILKGFANEAGHLGKIVLDGFVAQNFQDARIQAYDRVSPLLSQFSFNLDIPLHINQILVEELSTKNYLSELTFPFVVRPVPNFTTAHYNNEIGKIVSLYREALNSNSPNYQYLCFYKIIEGIRNKIKIRITQENQEARANGLSPIREKVILPLSKIEQGRWLNSIYSPQKWSVTSLEVIFPTEIVGKKINEVIGESKILDTVRNKIAHAILHNESIETYSIDKGLHIEEVHKWLPLCKCLARYLVKKEFPELFSILK